MSAKKFFFNFIKKKIMGAYMFTELFIQSLIHSTNTENLPFTRHCSGCRVQGSWGGDGEHKTSTSALLELAFCRVKQTTDESISKYTLHVDKYYRSRVGKVEVCIIVTTKQKQKCQLWKSQTKEEQSFKAYL